MRHSLYVKNIKVLFVNGVQILKKKFFLNDLM